jgi:hypothetical protein
MKYLYPILWGIAICALLLPACSSPAASVPQVINISYTNNNIQKQFDTLYNNQAVPGKGSSAIYKGFIEQASAICYDSADNRVGMQDVVSSMYLDTVTKKYNCVTTTVFRLKDGDITALGLFKLVPGDTIAPNHNFPITGGTGIYANSYGTYTRQYINGVYRVQLKYSQH